MADKRPAPPSCPPPPINGSTAAMKPRACRRLSLVEHPRHARLHRHRSHRPTVPSHRRQRPRSTRPPGQSSPPPRHPAHWQPTLTITPWRLPVRLALPSAATDQISPTGSDQQQRCQATCQAAEHVRTFFTGIEPFGSDCFAFVVVHTGSDDRAGLWCWLAGRCWSVPRCRRGR